MFHLFKKEKKEKNYLLNWCVFDKGKLTYRDVFSRIELKCLYIHDKNDKIIYYKYIMDVLKKEVQIDFISAVLYDGDASLTQRWRGADLIPKYYLDENLQEKKVAYIKCDKNIDFSKTTVFTFPWNIDRLEYAPSNVRRQGFVHIPNNHESEYYEGLDICIMTNGFHHVAVGVVENKGKTISRVSYDVESLFPYIDVNDEGLFIHVQNKEPYQCDINEKFDYRLRLIFKIARMIWELG